VQKPKADIYTVMLAIALVAILVACVCLFLEMKAYNYDIRAQEGKFRGAMLERSLPFAAIDAGTTEICADITLV